LEWVGNRGLDARASTLQDAGGPGAIQESVHVRGRPGDGKVGMSKLRPIDLILTLACRRTFTVDEKIRTQNWPDVLLERLLGEARRPLGWVRQPASMRLYRVRLCPGGYIRPVAGPCSTTRLALAWQAMDRVVRDAAAANQGCTSVGVSVPRGMLMQATVYAMLMA
jgi:hypothetical protein